MGAERNQGPGATFWEPPQRHGDLLGDPFAARVPHDVAAAPPLEADLGGDDDAIAASPPGESLADDLLGPSLPVGGCVGPVCSFSAAC